MNLLSRLYCIIFGHRRGKRMNNPDGHTSLFKPYPDDIIFSCPRCGATWTRKIKRKEAL